MMPLLPRQQLPVTLEDAITGLTLDTLEKLAIINALKRARNARRKAAESLGLRLKPFYSRIMKHKIDLADFPLHALTIESVTWAMKKHGSLRKAAAELDTHKDTLHAFIRTNNLTY